MLCATTYTVMVLTPRPRRGDRSPSHPEVRRNGQEHGRVLSQASRSSRRRVLASCALAACGCGGDDSATADGGDSGDSGDSTDKVGVILPDATTSPRWEANDRPSLAGSVRRRGRRVRHPERRGRRVETFGTLCDQMINEGVKVLMIVNLDQESGKACLDKATDAGVQSIDYDRLTLGRRRVLLRVVRQRGVGDLMGKGLITCLDEAGKTKANIVYINGAADRQQRGAVQAGLRGGPEAEDRLGRLHARRRPER